MMLYPGGGYVGAYFLLPQPVVLDDVVGPGIPLPAHRTLAFELELVLDVRGGLVTRLTKFPGTVRIGVVPNTGIRTRQEPQLPTVVALRPATGLRQERVLAQPGDLTLDAQSPVRRWQQVQDVVTVPLDAGRGTRGTVVVDTEVTLTLTAETGVTGQMQDDQELLDLGVL